MSAINFACLLTSNVGGLKSHDSQATYSIYHGLEVVHISGLSSRASLAQMPVALRRLSWFHLKLHDVQLPRRK